MLNTPEKTVKVIKKFYKN